MSIAGISLFLFAHQDDEFGVFAQIEQELRIGQRVCCIYVTDGASTANPDLRDAESRAALQKLGVFTDDIIFIGRELGIADGKLHHNISAFAAWLDHYVNSSLMLKTCFVPAWEGGHPDHDLVHAITVELLTMKDRSFRIWQYPLYNSRKCIGPFFRLMSPLPENGPINSFLIDWRDRIRYVRLCMAYPSQWRSWIGLFPFACFHYLCRGIQQLQHVNRARLLEPPHLRPLYYERRGFLDWSTLASVFKQFRNQKSVE